MGAFFFHLFLVELPTIVAREVIHTEPTVKGNTSGKVLKLAKIATDVQIPVALLVEISGKIEIDTRTGEYKSRNR